MRLCERKEKKIQETRSKSLLTVRFLCVSAPLRAKIKMLENEPSLLPCGLKKAINFRSPQKTQVTCV
jgi:hypothetical protein